MGPCGKGGVMDDGRVKFLWETFLASGSVRSPHVPIFCDHFPYCRSFYGWLRDEVGMTRTRAKEIATYARSSGIDAGYNE